MIELTPDELKERFSDKIFNLIGAMADELGMECYVVGGYVRDIFLQRPSKDIDVVVVGSGIAMAEALGKRLGKGAHVSVFKNFGTAQLKYRGTEVEFVGARKESYTHDSRKPIVENGTLEDDQNRRDFTINALAVCLNNARYGQLVDPFDGMADMRERIIRTPLDPDITFSDDPLRMMRCIRFATQLNFYIDDETFDSLSRNVERIGIISKERIADELNKIILSPTPSKGFVELDRSGLLPLIFPELSALQGVETKNGRAHKDNFYHTLEVLDNISQQTDNLWLRWAALLHDIAKPATKRWEPKVGWTFHNHNFVGERMIPNIFRTMKLPMNEKMKYVQKMVSLHMRPIVIADEEVADNPGIISGNAAAAYAIDENRFLYSYRLDERVAPAAATKLVTCMVVSDLLSQKKLSADEVTVTVTAENAKGEEVKLEADYCIVAVGRTAYTAGLGLENIGIKTEERGNKIPVNEHLETSVEGVYAIGDVVKGAMLAHKAEDEGVYVAERLAGQKPHINYNLIPGVVYTWPEVARVGATEEQLKEKGTKYKAGSFPFKASGRAKASMDTDGFVKVLADATTDEILGVHMIGPRAADMIAEAVVAMEFRASAEDIARICHAHPTYTEALKEAAMAATEKASETSILLHELLPSYPQIFRPTVSAPGMY